MTIESEKFIAAIERYCEWVEAPPHELLEARQLLLTLVASIPDVAKFRHAGNGERDYPRREYTDWKEDHQRFCGLPFQYYRTIFDPFDFDTPDEPITGDLHDDLADIYGDLWHGLQAHRAGEKEDALSIWVDSYFYHWGHHATSALTAIDEFYRRNGG